MESHPFPPGINILMGIVRYQSPISKCVHLVLEYEVATGESFWRLSGGNLSSTVRTVQIILHGHKIVKLTIGGDELKLKLQFLARSL